MVSIPGLRTVQLNSTKSRTAAIAYIPRLWRRSSDCARSFSKRATPLIGCTTSCAAKAPWSSWRVAAMADKPIREQSALELLETHAQALEQENARLTRELEIQKQAQNAITNGLCARNERLRAALAGSVEVIKTWHNMSRIGLRGDPMLEAVWNIYWRCAPEMKPIREALAGVETSQLHKCAHPVLIDSQEQPGV